MASNGWTLYGTTTMIATMLGGTVYGKLHKGDPEDGTMNPSSITTRSAMTFGAADSNGVFDLSAMVTWGTFAVKEQVWGVSLWTAATAGQCFYIRQFAASKNQFPGDTLDLVTLPIGFPVVGQ